MKLNSNNIDQIVLIVLIAVVYICFAKQDKGKLVVKKLAYDFSPLPINISEKLNVDPKSVTVAGFSSGGAQAMHFHLSHSSKVIGAGIFSGVVYLYGYYRKREDFFVNDIEKFNVSEAIHVTETFSIIGSIDPVENLNNSKVYVYHGRKDTTVESGSGKAIEDIYKHFGADLNCNINELEGEHGMPTENYGGPCGYLSVTHYLANDCKYQGAYEMYNHLYGGNLSKPLLGSVGTVPLKGEFVAFDQTEFLGDSSIHSMDKQGFMYIPSGCVDKACKMSIVFHGCLQNRQFFGDKFPKTTGFLEVAELNDIIQLYPNTKKTYYFPRNPSGCWDWIGFTGKDYPTRFGLQTAAVNRMLDRIVYGI